MLTAGVEREQMDASKLRILHYPDPRLRQRAQPVSAFDESLKALVERMYALMGADKGVGLAATQLGVAQRLVVMNATGQPGDQRVLVNPVIHEPHGSFEAEEGCLSLPGVNVQIRRAQRCRVVAQDLDGNPVEIEAQDLLARVCQHEIDHLNGVLIIDRMGPSDRIAARKTLRALEEQSRSGGKTR
jgi:peptide deformylase